MTRSTLVAFAAALVAGGAPLSAQATGAAVGRASSTKGFFLGAHLDASSVSADDFDEDTESGPGIALQLGYGFTPALALVLDGTGAVVDFDGDDAVLAHVDALLRYAFTGPTRRFVPFIDAGFSGFALAQDDATLETGETGDVSLRGAGFTWGGGAQYYFAPKWAFGLGVKFTSGEFDEIEVDNVTVSDLGIDAKTARVNVGLTWYAAGGR